ncbi:MAG TPA: ABC transporter ATP-binding protein [Burkholderiaceae bacterium]|nr:ABC transporter ATP-binding protein [Burkholderiaceae bacterium]
MTSNSAPVLEVRALSKRFGAKLAVKEVTFSIRHGEIVGLVGPNGAGKTTTINMILGVLDASAGSVTVAGLDIERHRSEALARSNFAATYAALPGNLTVEQNLRVIGLLYATPALGERVEQLVRQFELGPLRNTRCGLLSSGEQARVNLAKALMNRPELLLLDEPTASLDPAAAQTIREQIRALVQQNGCGILWTSHNMSEVEQVCDRVLFLSRGAILLEGDPRRLPGQHGARTLEELFIRIAREPLASAPDP